MVYKNFKNGHTVVEDLHCSGSPSITNTDWLVVGLSPIVTRRTWDYR